MMPQDPEEEKTCKLILDGLRGTSMMPIPIRENNLDGLSFVIKHPRKPNAKKTAKAPKAPKDAQE